MLRNILHRSLFVAVCLVTLPGLFYAVEDYRGRHALASYLRERAALGESFEWSALVPPPVPDAENFAAIPLFAELFPRPTTNAVLVLLPRRWPDCRAVTGNWHEGRPENLAAWQVCFSNQNLLVALARYAPVLDQITAASARPRTRFPIRYEDNFNALLPHLSVLRGLARIYRLRALAELAAGQTDAALADTRVGLRLAAALDNEPLIISFLVRAAILDLSIQPIWEGSITHRWNDRQLVVLQTELAKFDQFAAFARAMQGERLFTYHTTRWLIDKPAAERCRILAEALGSQPLRGFGKLIAWAAPTGWLYQNELTIDRFYTETYLPAIDAQHRRISPEAVKHVDGFLSTMRRTPYTFFCRLLLPAIPRLAEHAAKSQTAIDEATIACALERYRLAAGAYPDNLAALTPRYLAKVPLDVITGEPLHYRRMADGSFVLYSVGWNNRDDGGQIAFTGTGRSRHQDQDQGDWVWFGRATGGMPD